MISCLITAATLLQFSWLFVVSGEEAFADQRGYLAKLANIPPVVAVVQQQKWQDNGRISNGGFAMPTPSDAVGKALETAFPGAVPKGHLSNAKAADFMHLVHGHAVGLLGEAQKHVDALISGGKPARKLRSQIHNKIQAMPKLLEPLKTRYTKFADTVGKELKAKGYEVKPLPDLPAPPQKTKPKADDAAAKAAADVKDTPATAAGVKELEKNGNPAVAVIPPGTPMSKKKRWLRQTVKKWRVWANPVKWFKKLGRLLRIRRKKGAEETKNA